MFREPVELASKYLPRDRRQIRDDMAYASLRHMLVVGAVLKLYNDRRIDNYLLTELSRKLFKLVKRRYTHLWNINGNKSPGRAEWPTGWCGYEVENSSKN